MAGETAQQRSDSLRRWSRAATSRRRGSPAGPTAGAPGAMPAGRPAASCSSRSTSTRSAVPPPRPGWRMRAGTRGPPNRDASPSRPTTCRPRLAAAMLDPVADRGPRRAATSTALEPWLAAQPAGRRRAAARRPATAARHRRSRSPSPAPDGRTVAADGPEAADALRRLLERTGTPLVGHEVKPLLVAAFADDPGSAPLAGRLRHADRGLHPECRAAQPDHRRRRGRAARPDPAAGERAAGDRHAPVSRRWRRIAVREPLERRLADVNLERLFREIELPLIPVLARMEATGVALDRAALGRARSRVRRRDLAARAGDLRRRRPRVQPRQPQAARADPLLRAQPAEGQADEDRLLDRRLRAGGAPRRRTR